MPYIGNEVGNRFVASKAASVYSGNGSTTAFTLEHAVGSDEDILVSVDGVIQEPSVAYAVSSGTTLTFTAAPSSNSGNNIFVYYLFRTVATVDHPATSALSATSGTFSGAITGGGLLTTGGNIVIPNAGNIGSASDTDAMSISSGGVVTFTQQPVGTAMVKLLDATISSAVSEYDIDSTYINSTYDEYIISFSFLPSSDNNDLFMRVFVGGSVQTGSKYAYEAQADLHGSNQSNGQTYFRLNVSGIGNAAGEGIFGRIHLHNINTTTHPFNYTGMVNGASTSGSHFALDVGGMLLPADRGDVINGIRFYQSANNIASGKVRVYGLA